MGSQYVVPAGLAHTEVKPWGTRQSAFHNVLFQTHRRCLKVSSCCLTPAIPLHSRNSRPLLTEHSMTVITSPQYQIVPSSNKDVLESVCRTSSEITSNQTPFKQDYRLLVTCLSSSCLNHKDRLGDGCHPSSLSVDVLSNYSLSTTNRDLDMGT